MADMQFDDQDSTEDTYVASVKVSKIVKRDAKGQPVVRQATPAKERRIIEVTQLTIKARSLESLVKRLGAHLELIEED